VADLGHERCGDEKLARRDLTPRAGLLPEVKSPGRHGETLFEGTYLAATNNLDLLDKEVLPGAVGIAGQSYKMHYDAETNEMEDASYYRFPYGGNLGRGTHVATGNRYRPACPQ
jgi:hypothetical protein